MNESRFSRVFLAAMAVVAIAMSIGLVVYLMTGIEGRPETSQVASPMVDGDGRIGSASISNRVEKALSPADSAYGPSLAAKFSALAGTGDPADAFRAYDLATRCAESQADERAAERQALGERSAETVAALNDGTFKAASTTYCGDLSSAQIADRTKYLKQAAEAGVPMAAIRLVEQGPWGDPSALTTRPNDPAVLEWRRQMVGLIEFAASKGDYAAMDSLSTMYRTGSGVLGERDPGKALMYATAKWEAYRQATGRTSAYATQEVSQLASALSPQEASAATTAGQQFALVATSGARK